MRPLLYKATFMIKKERRKRKKSIEAAIPVENGGIGRQEKKTLTRGSQVSRVEKKKDPGYQGQQRGEN